MNRNLQRFYTLEFIRQVHTLEIWKFETETIFLQLNSDSLGLDSDRENEFKCKRALIRKVTNFIEKNASRLVYTEHAPCSVN